MATSELAQHEPSSYDAPMDQICDDLEAETAALAAVVDAISEEQWTADTPAVGWDVKDTIIHLIQADVAASLAVMEPEEFKELKAAMATDPRAGLSRFGERDDRSGAEVWQWFSDERSRMIAAFRTRGPKERIPWFGPDMSTLSFATARLMETWSHGQDVADTLGQPWPTTDRLRHVCHIGVTTRGWSYINRGMEIPEGPVRVELSSPSGQTWDWGPADATDRVTGSALDFALVTTQRRHHTQSGLVGEGPLATEWLTIAQAFAGPPTLPEGRIDS